MDTNRIHNAEVLFELNTHWPQLSSMKYGGVQNRSLTEAIFGLGVVDNFYCLCIYWESKHFCTINMYHFGKQLLSKKLSSKHCGECEIWKLPLPTQGTFLSATGSSCSWLPCNLPPALFRKYNKIRRMEPYKDYICIKKKLWKKYTTYLIFLIQKSSFLEWFDLYLCKICRMKVK